jgi:hypothetical protein
MSDEDAAMEGSQRGDHGRGGVAMHEHAVWAHLVEHGIDRRKGPAGQPVQGLVAGHQTEVVVRLYAEQLQHLIQHLPMLAGHADNGCREAALPQRLDHRRHLYGLGSRPEN